MKKMIRNFIMTSSVIVFALCQTMTNAYAAMDVPIQIKCDSGISLQDSDTFTISYYSMDDEAQTITSVEVNAAKAGHVTVDDGMYRIKSIKYNGTNEKIKKSYGVSGDFSAYSDINETVPITLTAGSESTKALEGTYDPQNADSEYKVIMDENHDENGQPKDGYIEGLDENIIPDEEFDANTSSDVNKNSSTEGSDWDKLDQEILGEDGNSTTAPGSAEVIVEYYGKDDSVSHSHRILWKLVPLGVIFVIAMTGVYIAYKKGIF